MADNKKVTQYWDLVASMNGAGYYKKVQGTSIGTIQWFDTYPGSSEWSYYAPADSIPDSLDAISKADRTKLEDFFSNTIDQVSFGTEDYNRLRKLIIDLYASHRSLITASTQLSDPHSLSNSDLDELFRSFGYLYSTQLNSFNENPLEQKIQFFLDLVNLYKVKGTPQSLVDVLQYYGVTAVDIYEFFLKLNDPSTLIFEGKAVAGTTSNPSNINFPFANLTSNDPHWLYTAQQILQLNQNLKINLPSKSPYIGVRPVVDVDGSEMSILVRKVQDQYIYYTDTGILPEANAQITYIGEVRSLLELYLSTVYMFNELYSVGADATSYICYDGTNTEAVDIVAEYESIAQMPSSRADQKIRLEQYYDLFTRLRPTNFLQNSSDAGTYLNSIAPDIYASLSAAPEPLEVLYTLLKDLAIWVRNNLGLGFVNFGFILFGIEAFFKDLKPVIDFFKPYRARLLLLESFQVKNRLFNSIIIEDSESHDVDLQFHDFVTADSTPCCGEDVDIDTTSVIVCDGETTHCSREIIDPTTILVWKGIWMDGLLYSVGDGIPDGDNNHYVCIASHTSSSFNKPASGADWALYWKKVSQIACTDTTGGLYYSRETYDCGSNFDYGAAIDTDPFIEITDEIHDHMRCPTSDTTGYVVSELIPGTEDLAPDGTAYVGYEYYQSGGFRDFDGVPSTSIPVYVNSYDGTSVVPVFVGYGPEPGTEGTFDCTHGFDQVFITVIQEGAYLLQESEFKILQENEGGILLYD
jgi:hypothetical protein